MEILSYLKNEIDGKTTLPELVDVFEKMSLIELEGVEADDDMLLFETGTFDFTGENLFYFSLARQFPNGEDEYFQLHLDICFTPDKINKKFHKTLWSDEFDHKAEFFEAVRSSKAYAALECARIVSVDCFMDET